jgi:hypothetical protein
MANESYSIDEEGLLDILARGAESLGPMVVSWGVEMG